jgi:hypothetical protein
MLGCSSVVAQLAASKEWLSSVSKYYHAFSGQELSTVTPENIV